MDRHILGVLPSILLAFTASAADWVYDPNAGTITDGDWTFAATVSGTALTVGAHSVHPASGVLDFSKAVSDGSTTYTIVALNCHLGNGTSHKDFGPTDASAAVTELRLPTSELTTIGIIAFGYMTNCTQVVPFLPDSVATIGEAAFFRLPVEDGLHLRGIDTVGSRSFQYSGITNLTFGASLKHLKGGWAGGCFDHCTKLKTINFDPNMSGASFDNEGVFAYCSGLSGTIDLSGFTYLGNTGLGQGRLFYAYKGNITKIILSSDITSVSSQTLLYLHTVKEVVFTGGVPTLSANSAPLYSMFHHNLSLNWSDCYTVVPEAYKDEWAQFCENDTINDLNSYWDPALVSNSKTKNVFLVSSGADAGENLGYWVYDGTNVASTNGLWSFEATLVGARALTVGACNRYPNDVSDLDFSKSVTDTNGYPFGFVNLSTAFGVGGSNVGGVTAAAGAGSVGRLFLPTNHLVKIGDRAFACCTKLTEVTPLIPDTVTYLGSYAFLRVPFASGKGDARLYGVMVGNNGVFYNSTITSATFGPAFTAFNSGNNNSPFGNCTALTNVTFDAAMSNAVFNGTAVGPFEGCSALMKLDLSGFSTLGFNSSGGHYIGSLGAMSNLGEIIAGTDVTVVGRNFFTDLPALTNVTFRGRVPTTVDTPYLYNLSAAKKITTCVYKAYLAETNTAGRCWLDYSATGKIYRRGTTWAADYLPGGIDLANRPLVTVEDVHPEFCILVR